jgi:hypothetical protein
VAVVYITLSRMLPFRDALNNDNPVSDALNLDELNNWYFAAILIGSNFFGAPLVVYCHRHAFFLLAAATFFAVVFSLLYHTCQTLHVCFGLSLSVLTLADHISAPSFMMMLIQFIINTKSAKQIRNEVRQRALQYIEDGGYLPTPKDVKVDIEEEEEEAPLLPPPSASNTAAVIATRQHLQLTNDFHRFLSPLTYDNRARFQKQQQQQQQQLAAATVSKYDEETNLDDDEVEEIE